jgi:hypothetical protein
LRFYLCYCSLGENLALFSLANLARNGGLPTFAVKVRRSILSIFLDSDLPPALENARRKTIVVTLVMAALYTSSCAFSSSDPNILPWWFLAAALWSMVTQLSVLQLSKTKHKRRLAFALLKNLRELIIIVTIVFGLYSVATVFIGHLPLDNTSLVPAQAVGTGYLQHPCISQGLQVFSPATISAVRGTGFAPRRRSPVHDGAMVDRAGKWLKFSFTAIERLSLSFLIAASLTFLGTHAAGVRSSTRLRNGESKCLQIDLSIEERARTVVPPKSPDRSEVEE